MITEFGQGKYYLYRHIRLDTGKPFYIGIGTKVDYSRPYSRSYSIKDRNNFWKNIVNKTTYEIEIILESNDYEFVKQKEIEFITLYGRKDLKKGTLCNMTDGGDGITGKYKNQPIYIYNKKGKYISKCLSLHEAFLLTNVTKTKIISICKKRYRCKFSHGFTFRYYYKPYIKRELINKLKRPVIDTSTNIIYESISSASLDLKINEATLYYYLIGKRKNKTSLQFYYGRFSFKGNQTD